jgi:hypothetical protein
MNYYYGSSKDIKQVKLDSALLKEAQKALPPTARTQFLSVIKNKGKKILSIDQEKLQDAWMHKIHGVGPYDIVDDIGEMGRDLRKYFDKIDLTTTAQFVFRKLGLAYEKDCIEKNGNRKIMSNSREILTGLLLGAWFNSQLSEQKRKLSSL